LVRVRVKVCLSNRKCVDDGLQRRRCRDNLTAHGGARHVRQKSLTEMLTESFKIRVEEYAIFRDGPAKATAVLIHMEGRYRGSIERRPRIECAVPQILEYAAMKLIAAGLGDDIDLSASSGTAFRSVDGGVYTELGDRFQRDLQSRFRFLWLFLD